MGPLEGLIRRHPCEVYRHQTILSRWHCVRALADPWRVTFGACMRSNPANTFNTCTRAEPHPPWLLWGLRLARRLVLSHLAPQTLYTPLGAAGMAEPAAAEPPVGWPAAEVALLDAGVPLDPPVYRSMVDAQVAAPEGQLHPDLAALNAGQPAPAARAVQLAQGEPQTLPYIIESCFVPMLHLRRSLLVFEPRGQLAQVRQARKRRRTGRREDGQPRAASNSYPGR